MLKKRIQSLVFVLGMLQLSFTTFAQNKITVTENNQSFTNGTHNAYIATVPYANKDVISKAVKSELKSWKGKVKGAKDEFTVTQAKTKAMGDKFYDSYVKIYQAGNDVLIAVSTDLGGAYLNSIDHVAQGAAMRAQVTALAAAASKASIDESVKAEEKVLKTMEKAVSKSESQKKSLEKSIENSKKAIEKAEKDIKNLENSNAEQLEKIKSQKNKVNEISNLKNTIN